MESFASENIGCASVQVPITLQVGIGVVLLLSSVACTAERPPLVTETEAPWQHRYEVESGLAQEGTRSTKLGVSGAVHEDDVSPPLPPPPESTGEQLAHVFADVLAFPFRGVGWVVQKIF